MKIGHASTPQADAALLARANAETGAAAARAGQAQQQAAAGASTVHLSSAAAGLKAEASAPEFDAAKVERIRAAIAAGTYAVNPEAIADKLIANAQEVLAAARR